MFLAARLLTYGMRQMVRTNSKTRLRLSGFTLIEATVAITITVLAGSAILLGINSAIGTSTDIVHQQIAQGMAQQLVDEILGTMYAQPGSGAHQVGMSANSYELAGMGRERYNDIDDFHGVRSSAPKDIYGVPLGTENGLGGTRPVIFQVPGNYFGRWRQAVQVYYVNANDFSQRLTGSNTSDYRCVDITIEINDPTRGWLPLARVQRIVTFLQVP
jgi:type II secretory pathway pseudopilin PulG